MPTTTPKTGILTISLDFEMTWGMHDHADLSHYQENLKGERNAVERLLKLFATYDIHVTWATVGFLFFSTKEELLKNLPTRLPAYKKSELSPYRLLEELGADEIEESTNLAGSLLAQISAVPGQEIATHTFSHYFCLEEGQSLEDFRADLQAAVNAADLHGLKLTSLVFPRNQCNEDYLAVCREFGITAYRGNESSWMYHAASGQEERPWRRAARLLDAYLPLSGSNTYPHADVFKTTPFNIPSSRFLRPYLPSLSWLESLRLYRIKRDLRHAAERGEIYHLWWHPHNFGINADKNFFVLEQILKEFVRLRDEGKMISLNMREIATRV